MVDPISLVVAIAAPAAIATVKSVFESIWKKRNDIKITVQGDDGRIAKINLSEVLNMSKDQLGKTIARMEKR